MAPIRFFCLSDLHLGAGISLLTDVDEAGRAQPRKTGPVLETLGAAVRRFLPPLCGDSPPTLVLLGDVFDLAFSSTQDAALAFRCFIEAFFPKGQPPVFSNEVLYVPGNHDHREWQVVKDKLFLGKLLETHWEVPGLVEVTPLFHELEVQSEMATALMQSATSDRDSKVYVACPNFGFQAGERCVVMHHGHYIESMYRMVTQIEQWLTPGMPAPDDIEMIERQNGAWIDFLWSTFGDAGVAGAEVFDLYEALQDAAASHDLVKRLAERILHSLGKSFPIHASTEVSAHGVHLELGGVTEGLLDLFIGRAGDSERLSNQRVLSESSIAGLRWYLGAPVHRQIQDAKLDPAATEVTFIFGHTHKPFQDQLVVDGYRAPVNVFNTGGWVLDDPGMSPTHGAAAVLVDDEANVASLRLFNDSPNGADHPVGPPVRAEGTWGFADRDNPLLARLKAALAASPTLWNDFSRAVAEGIELRGRTARSRFFDPKAMPSVEVDLGALEDSP